MGLARAVATAAVAVCLGGCSGTPSDGPDFEVDYLSEENGGAQAEAPRAPKSKSKASEDDSDSEEPEEESAPPPPDKPAPEPPPQPPKEVDKTATYKGSLGSSPGANFASSSCRYTVTMKSINVEVGTNKTGDVTNAAVRNFMIETTPGCKTPLIPAQNQEYRFGYVEKKANGWRVGLVPAPQNQPKANVTLDLVTTADGFDTGVTWHRYDNPNGNLNYTVRAQLTLRKE